MSSWAEFSVAGVGILSTRSYADPVLMSVFDENDRYVDTTEDEPQSAIGYRAPISVVIDRLEVMSFTLQRSKEVFESATRARLQELQDQQEIFDSDFTRRKIKLLERLTFARWLSAFKKLAPVWASTTFVADSYAGLGISGDLIEYIE